MEKNKAILGIFITLLVVCLATVAVLAVYVFTMLGNGNGGDAIGGTYVVQIPRPQDIDWVELGNEAIVTNLALGADNRNSILRATVLVGVNNTAPRRELDDFNRIFNERIAYARSIATTAMFMSTLADVRSPEGKEALAERIRLDLLEAFDTNLIVNVRFDNWLLT